MWMVWKYVLRHLDGSHQLSYKVPPVPLRAPPGRLASSPDQTLDSRSQGPLSSYPRSIILTALAPHRNPPSLTPSPIFLIREGSQVRLSGLKTAP